MLPCYVKKVSPVDKSTLEKSIQFDLIEHTTIYSISFGAEIYCILIIKNDYCCSSFLSSDCSLMKHSSFMSAEN